MTYHQNTPTEDYSKTTQKKASHFVPEHYKYPQTNGQTNDNYGFNSVASTPKFLGNSEGEKNKFEALAWENYE